MKCQNVRWEFIFDSNHTRKSAYLMNINSDYGAKKEDEQKLDQLMGINFFFYLVSCCALQKWSRPAPLLIIIIIIFACNSREKKCSLEWVWVYETRLNLLFRHIHIKFNANSPDKHKPLAALVCPAGAWHTIEWNLKRDKVLESEAKGKHFLSLLIERDER